MSVRLKAPDVVGRSDAWVVDGVSPVGLMIAGAAKAGTTSLKEYLGQHPGVFAHPQRGISFFNDEREYGLGYAANLRTHYGGTPPAGAVVLGKSVPVLYSRLAMERLREHNPTVTVVVILREPVGRAYSEFWYARRRGWEPLETFEDALEAGRGREADPAFDERRCYVHRSDYLVHFEHLLDLFPREQVVVLRIEDLKDAPGRACRQVFEAAGVDPEFVPDFDRSHNRAALPRSRLVLRFLSDKQTLAWAKGLARRILPPQLHAGLKAKATRLNEVPFQPPPMQESTRRGLAEYFAPRTRELERRLDMDFPTWPAT